MYYGVFIVVLYYLGKEKGYELVGFNSVGNNFFFVCNDCLGSLCVFFLLESYVELKMRELCDRGGKLMFKFGV